jgi:hypothetical protein
VDADGNNSEISVQLKVDSKPDGAFADLVFVNNSASKEAFLYKYNTCIVGRIRNNVFKIQSEGKPIQYIGKLAKRPDPRPEDFAKLDPQSSLRCVVRLDEAYDFAPGSHAYEIEYFALHPYLGKPGYVKLRSNRVQINYSPTK